MKPILKLIRINMSSAIAFSAMVGYIFRSGEFTWVTLAVFTGVLLLAAAATTLNQYQERHLDVLMLRTRDRPLASKQMNPRSAIFLAIAMAVSGTSVLYFFTNPITAALGLFNILWYNGIYTPLKTKTSFVVIIGALTGAIPPMMGWTAAGGNMLDPEIIFVSLFFFLWQIPHFLLLLLRYKEDYDKAGFKSITGTMNDNQVKFVVFVWILSTSLSTLLFPVFHIISGDILIGFIILLNIVLISFFYRSVFSKKLFFNLGRAFGSLYLYQISILFILIFQALK